MEFKKGDKVKCIRSSIIHYWKWEDRIIGFDKQHDVVEVDMISGNHISFKNKHFFHPKEKFILV